MGKHRTRSQDQSTEKIRKTIRDELGLSDKEVKQSFLTFCYLYSKGDTYLDILNNVKKSIGSKILDFFLLVGCETILKTVLEDLDNEIGEN